MSPSYFYNIAKNYEKSNRHNKAIAAYTKAIDLDPNYSH
ncbi:MAG: tetratricopeptide repeat protein, partial [Candidatus Acidulodesulfobacterium sp.]